MIGLVILSHYHLADELLGVLRLIVDDIEHVHAVGLDPTKTSPEDMRSLLDKAIRGANTGDGVLVLVDMFGGTPSNLALSFMEEDEVEIVTGVNMPMLVKVARTREGTTIHALAELARDYGRHNISVASDVLAGHEGEVSGE
ncbi:MAG: PTS fructose transporter subunit IIA [bacterium]|nr:PTS fructose transporter subunit IIA [bacterium]